MAITVTSLLNSGDATDRTGPSNPYSPGTVISGGSSTDLHVLAIIGIMGSSVTPPAPTSVTQSGATWTKDTRVGGGSGVLGFKTTATNRFSVSLWYCGGVLPTGGGTGISIDFGSNAMIGCAWQLLRISGGDASGGALAEIFQLATNTNETLATTGTIAASLSAAVTSASRVFYFATYNTNDANNTVESGHTQIARLPSQTSPAVGMVSGWHATSFDTSPSITNSTGSTNAYGIIAFEVPVALVSQAVTRGTESDIGRTITAGKSLEVGRASETDVARSVTAGIGLEVGRATESDAARGINAAKSKQITLYAQSTHTARTVGKGKGVVRADEVDIARDLGTATIVVSVGRAEEINEARKVHQPRPYVPLPEPITTTTRIPTPISFVLGKMDGGENFGPALEEMIDPQIVLLWGPYEGSLSFKYPVGGLNWDQLVEKQEIIVLVDGQERQDICSRFYVQKVEYDALAKQPVEEVDHPLRTGETVQQRQAATITVTCAQLWKRFDEYTIQPLTGAVTTHDKFWLAGTAGGEPARWVLTDAHEHGALAEITRDFDDTHTSDDLPWEKTVELTYPRGTTGLPVIQWLWEQHAAEFTFAGRTLQAYNWDTLPVNWANADGPKILLVSGRDFLDAPVVNDYTELFNFVTVYGDEGRYATAQEEGATAYRMVSKQASGIKDTAVLQELADMWLEFYSLTRVERNYAIVMGWGHDPFITYIPGDEILVQDGSDIDPDTFDAKPFRIRVYQMTLRKNATGEWSADIVCRDRLWRQAERFLRQINGLIGGGPGVARPSRYAVPPDAPHGPLGVDDPPTVVAEIYTPEIGSGGKNYARITATAIWSGNDEDGELCGDFDRYWLRWQYGNTKPGWNEVPGDGDPDVAPEIIVDGLEPGKTIRVQLGAGDTTGHIGWSETELLVLPTDNGEYRAFDGDGQDIFRITDDGQWHATKVPGGSAKMVGVGPTATGAGIDIDSVSGYRVFGDDGTRLIYHDYSSGSAEYLGDLHVGGDFTADGITNLKNDTTVWDVFTVHAASVFDGDVSIGSKILFDSGSGSLSLGGDLDLDGHTVHGGAFDTDGGIVVDNDSITFGANVVSFTGGLITVSDDFAVGGAFQVSGGSTLNGTTSMTGNVNIGNASGDSIGFYGVSGTTRQSLPGAGVVTADDIRAVLITIGICT